ncbi:sulfatase [Halosimplex salinum]|uniref:sulfatase n=1 Tax=Halosimplex salinum TaxID=1710538 RepID=UPI000F495861|nr:sulfatase [Halosimplex salinum]
MHADGSNVVLLTVDCFRYDRCGFTGHHRHTTPFLDELASESVVFDSAYASGPDTSESFPGILAGRLSRDCAYVESPTRKALPDDADTVASHFRENGYETLAVISNPQLTRRRNFDAGFDHFENLRVPEQNESTDEPTTERDADNPLLRRLSVGQRLYDFRRRMKRLDSLPFYYKAPVVALREYQYRTDWPTVPGEEIVSRAETALADASTPFFLWVHLMDLHGPIHPDTVREGGLCTAGPRTQFGWDADRMADIEDPRCELRYDSALRYVDSQIERFVDGLRSAGHWDDTALVVTGDHGEALHDRGQYGHPHHYLYDDLLHVPVVVRDPSTDRGVDRTDRPFSLAWMHQLLSELAELPDAPVPESSDSNPFEEDDTGPILADSISPEGHTVSVRDDGHKAIVHSDPDSGSDEGVEIYHTDIDRGERRDVAPTYPGSSLESRATQLTVQPTALPELGAEMSDQVEDRLKELGYMN